MSERIVPRILKGFRDLLPEEAAKRQQLIGELCKVFSTASFVPIETPALEYSEILLGKGSGETDKQMYRFSDNGGRDVALRFDLTLPLARYVSMHANELSFPLRRYHIAPVWRAEKPQKGRYREFLQCDFDIVGSHSPICDAEILLVAHRALRSLGVEHEIRLSDRRILDTFFKNLGLGAKTQALLRSIDKLEKIGREAVGEELKIQSDLNEKQVADIFAFLELSSPTRSKWEIICEVAKALGEEPSAKNGLSQLEGILAYLDSCSSPECFRLDLSVARGLDYYTGCVFETYAKGKEGVGSISSGGRYDDLAGLYSKNSLPGVGASIGLDRVMLCLEDLHRNDREDPVMLTLSDRESAPEIFSIAELLRNRGIVAEVFHDFIKLSKQLRIADRRGMRFVVLFTSDGLRESKTCSIKDLRNSLQHDEIPTSQLADKLLEMRKNAKKN